MENLIDFTRCKEIKEYGYNGSNGIKRCIEYNNEIYMLKIFNNPDKYSNSAISEYISCHIYDSLGFNVQQTLIGIYNIGGINYQAVACKDFLLNEKERILELKDFASYKNQVVNSQSNGYGTEVNDIVDSIQHLGIMDSVTITEYFWDMFICDALLGNFDRHNGNWGFVVDRKTHQVEFSPIYDCASCLYPALSEKDMVNYLSDKEKTEIDKRIYVFPNSAIKIDGKKINYYEFINSLQNSDCNAALLRIYSRIDIGKINNIIDGTPNISNNRKKFYKTMIAERFEKILVPAYEKIKARNKELEHPQDKLEINPDKTDDFGGDYY